MIDIVIITNTSVFKRTQISLDMYAAEQQIITRTNSGVDWSNGERLAEYRLEAVKEATADWVFLLDHDDELAQPLPSVKQMSTYDYIVFPFYDTNGKIRSVKNCSSQRVFGFHMILAKREAAIEALQYVREGRFYRDDTAYLIWLMESGRGIQAVEPLVRKIGDHLPREIPELREVMKQECREIWRDRLFKTRQNLLGRGL